MADFETYRDAFNCVNMERRGGIIQLALHTDGGPLTWGRYPDTHRQMTAALTEVANDPENRVVIITGTGDSFCGPPASMDTFPSGGPLRWEAIRQNGLRLINALLDMPGPVIGCLNGPAYRHSQIPLLGDIVLAAEHASIQDSAHYPNRTVPGDGVHLFFPLLMGWNRGRYFLLTGQVLDAAEMKTLGLVNEVLSPDRLLPRAWELAEQLAGQNELTLRYTRLMLTAPLKALVNQHLGYGLALEGLAGSFEEGLHS